MQEGVEDQSMQDNALPAPARTRRDPRTGKVMTVQSRQFWQEHVQGRLASGQSVLQYCQQQQLALSTFRRWSSRLSDAHSSHCPAKAIVPQSKAEQGYAFLPMPIRQACESPEPSAQPCQIEVRTTLGAHILLYGRAADRAIDLVLTQIGAQR